MLAPPDSSDAGAAAPDTELEALQRELPSALDRRDLDALGPLAARAEAQAAQLQVAQPLWLLAARARHLRVESLAIQAAKAAVDPTAPIPARELLARVTAEATPCAADARHAWSSLALDAAAAIDTGQPPEAALATAPPAAAEPLYLDALCTAAWARARGFTFLVERRAILLAELSRAAALAPLLDDAGPDRELGRLLAALPGYAGGDLSLARAHFEAAIHDAPAALENRLAFARTVAVKLQDRHLFTQLLQDTLAQPASTPEAQAAQSEARSLLDHGDDLFGVAAVPHDPAPR